MNIATVDVAGYIDESTHVHFIRGGIVHTEKTQGLSLLDTAKWVAGRVESLNPRTVLVDTSGMGRPVFDILLASLKEPIQVIGVNS